MKIAIVVPIMGTFGRKGYYHSQEIGLGRSLVARGHQVVVYKCISLNKGNTISREEHDGLHILYIPTRALGVHGDFNPSILEADTDLVFVFADTQLCIPKIYHYCKKKHIPLVPYIGIAHSFQQNIKSRIMDLMFAATTLQVYKKIPVLTKTIAAKEELASLGVKHCIVAPVGMDFSALHGDYANESRTDLRQKWGFSHTDTIVSYVARLEKEKHPLEMVEIFARSRQSNHRLLMVGKGSLLNAVKNRIRELGLNDYATIFEEIPYQEMWQIHYISDFFINLRREEIFGMAIMEAVFYRSCVAALSAPGPDTILADLPGHFICHSYDEISNLLQNHHIDEGELTVSKGILENNFTWNRCCDALLNLHR